MPTVAKPECPIVLLSEKQQDLVVFQAALLRSGTAIRLHPFLSAGTAVEWLRGRSPFFDRGVSLPLSVFLCDYDLGTTKGHEVVPLIRAQPSGASMSFIMLGGGDKDQEVVRSYRAGANHFLQKPSVAARMDMLVRTLYECAVTTSFTALTKLEEYRCWPASAGREP